MNIGILVAVEFDAFFNKYGEPKKTSLHGPIKVYEYEIAGKNIFVAESNAGQIRASVAMTILLEVYNCKIILNYGVVGALSEQELEALGVVEGVYHVEWDTTGADDVVKGQYGFMDSPLIKTSKRLLDLALKIDPKLQIVKLASGDKFVDTADEKKALREEWGADIVDMEGAAVALISRLYGAECIMLKAVSDTLSGGADEYYKNFEKTSKVAIDVLGKMIEEL